MGVGELVERLKFEMWLGIQLFKTVKSLCNRYMNMVSKISKVTNAHNIKVKISYEHC